MECQRVDFCSKKKTGDRHILRYMIDFYEIPTWAIHNIKKGGDFVSSTGALIKNDVLTKAPQRGKRFAYCSDTAYSEKLIHLIEGVDCLYHEATFMNDEILRAKQTLHSTAAQAALIAQKAGVGKLIIGHFSARYHNKQGLLEEAKKIFENTVLAEDMNSYDI